MAELLKGLFNMRVFLLLFFMVSNIWAQSLEWTKIESLYPTESAVGEKEVASRADEYQQMSHSEMQKYLLENPILVVKGPKDKLYVIDHTHQCKALQSIGIENVTYTLAGDLSNLNATDFWKKMIEKEWVWLEDESGNKIEPSQLPTHIKDLKNDPFRALAYFVRKKGGFDKTDKPFAEFYWADFFRTYFTLDELNQDWKKAVHKAVDLAQSSEASNLPGYRGNNCKQKLAN
jgi:hypothetical protein